MTETKAHDSDPCQFRHKAVQCFTHHFDQIDCIEDIALFLETPKSSLNRKFHNHFGVSPSKFLWRFKLRYSELILNANIARSLTDVCVLSGFNSLSHFSKKFKNHYGHSPSQLHSRNHDAYNSIYYDEHKLKMLRLEAFSKINSNPKNNLTNQD